jgi:CRP-like cAMP-binding protein
MISRTYGKDEVVYFRGDPSQALYLIKKGTVELSIRVQKNKETVGRRTENTLFGEEAFLSHTHRNLNAVVLSSQAEIIAVPHEPLMDILEKTPEIGAHVYRNLYENNNNYMGYLLEIYQNEYGFFELGKVGAKF